MFSRNSMSRRCLPLILAACVCGSMALAAKEPSTVIVTPARARVVQLAQDVFQIRQISVVSYQGAVNTLDPVLHKWDGKHWKRITFDEYQATLPERVILIGDQKTLPAVMIEAASRSQDTLNIAAFDSGTIVSAFAKLFDLSPSEQISLSRKNSVVVVDKNAALSRYGKYYPGPGFDTLQSKPGPDPRPEEGSVPPEPELPALKSEPVNPAQAEPAEKHPAVMPPAPEKSKVDVAPEDK